MKRKRVHRKHKWYVNEMTTLRCLGNNSAHIKIAVLLMEYKKLTTQEIADKLGVENGAALKRQLWKLVQIYDILTWEWVSPKSLSKRWLLRKDEFLFAVIRLFDDKYHERIINKAEENKT